MNDAYSPQVARAMEKFVSAMERLEQAPKFAKSRHVNRVLDTADRVLSHDGGVSAVYQWADRFDDAGLFIGSDWDHPDRLKASFVPATFASLDRCAITLECLSQLRLVAIAEGRCTRIGFSAEQATHYLRDILAMCLEFVFERQTEAARVHDDRTRGARRVVRFVADSIGNANLLDQLVGEIWRLLRQRPICVAPVRAMIMNLSIYCYDESHENVAVPVGAERLISALYSPSPATREDPGIDVYQERLASMDANYLRGEASACARSMHDTGLVSEYHAVLVRHLLDHAPDLIGVAIGLSTTGLDSFLTYRELVQALIRHAVHPATCQCLYGLAALLERAVLHNPSVAPSLWRQLKLPLVDIAQQRIASAFGTAQPPEVFLLADVISVLGQPLGVGQGDNATCQAARAISMWAYSDPDYLLQLLAWAGRDDGILMKFHDRQISSAFLPDGAAGTVGRDLDGVSMVLVPHLDRVYAEMTRLAEREGEDPHLQVNPEFHGWRVGRGFAIAVDVATQELADYDDFIRLFYACYHPGFNGGHPVIHPQPVGLAVTDSLARFVGWHAITLLRVALDPSGVVRVYFYNPNNDSGQDWGNGVVVSTEGHGEVHGEASLPVPSFASRLYLFHYDLLEVWDKSGVPAVEVEEVMQLGKASWASTWLPARREGA